MVNGKFSEATLLQLGWRLPTIAATFQYCGGALPGRKTRNENKKCNTEQKETKLLVFAVNITIYLENPQKPKGYSNQIWIHHGEIYKINTQNWYTINIIQDNIAFDNLIHKRKQKNLKNTSDKPNKKYEQKKCMKL